MKILAIDTSSMMSSICVLEDGKILGEFNLNQDMTHAKNLLPMTQILLDGLDINLEEIDLFAVGIGPGSFTGLRIGISAVKTLAQVLDKKIIGVSSMEAMAYGVLSDKLIMPLVDARGKRFFTGIYQWKNKELVSKQAEAMYKWQDIYEFLSNLKEQVFLVGDATALLEEDLSELENITYATARQDNGLAVNIGLIAMEKAKTGNFDSYYDLAPNYIRKSQAEIDYGKKTNRSN